MRRWLALVAVGLVGLVTGGATSLSTLAPATPGPVSDDRSATPSVEARPIETSAGGLLLVWTAGALPDGLAAAVAELPRVEATTLVRGGRVDLVSSQDALGTPVDAFADGWRVPLDALAIDPQSYARFVPAADRSVIESLGPGKALLGATSADLRRLDTGDSLTLHDGSTLQVAGVVADDVVGAAELVVSTSEADRLGLTRDRFLLVTHDGDRPELEAAIRRVAEVEVRVRGPGETPYLRHGDAVLPQALVKERFGEFAYRPTEDGTWVEQEPGWVADNVITADVPVLGQVRCHRGVVRQVRGALQELEQRGLSHLVDPDTFAGCHAARLIAPGGMLSRHAWGIALDLNAEANPTGLASVQDPRLVETFAQWGLTWGGFWLVPDPMHLEYVSPPQVDPGKVTAAD